MDKESEGKIEFLVVTIAALLTLTLNDVFSLQHTIVGIVLMFLLSWSRTTFSPPNGLYSAVWAL
jgi:hypothetical protein